MDRDTPLRAAASPDASALHESALNNGPSYALLATLAHEVRNRLAPVRNALYLLRGRAANDDGAAWAIDLIDRQVQQLNALIDEVSDLSRLMRGTLPAASEAVDLADVVAAAAAASAPAFDAKRQALQCRMPPERMGTFGDRTRLIQALAAVLRAASGLGRPGSQFLLRTERAGSDVVITVHVTQETARDAAWLAATEASESASQGPLSVSLDSGVGLALAQRLLALHGGSLTATPDATGPARFAIRLPLVAATP